MNNALAQTSNNEFSALITTIERVATDPSVDIEKLEKILNMQERVLTKNAEISFNRSMVLTQQNMPIVVKDGTNKQTNSNYAKLETLLKIAKPVYTDNGFCLSFGTQDSTIQDHIRVTCEVRHVEGHSKSYFYDSPIDNTGLKGTVNKTLTHGRASALSYAQRYLLTLVFNITIANHDNDGNFDSTEWIDTIKKIDNISELDELYYKAKRQGLLTHLNHDFLQRKRQLSGSPEDRSAPLGNAIYSDDDFNKKLPMWKELILSGSKTHDEIINFLSHKDINLSQKQIETIKGIK